MIRKLAIYATLLALGAYAYADSHAMDPATFDLRTVSCGELTTMTEEQQGYVVVMIFGYQAGKSDKPLQTAAMIDSQIKTAYQTCANRPEMTILQAMEAAAQGVGP